MTDFNKVTKIFFNIIFTGHIQNEIIIDDVNLLTRLKKGINSEHFSFSNQNILRLENSNTNIKSNSNDKRRFG